MGCLKMDLHGQKKMVVTQYSVMVWISMTWEFGGQRHFGKPWERNIILSVQPKPCKNECGADEFLRLAATSMAYDRAQISGTDHVDFAESILGLSLWVSSGFCFSSPAELDSFCWPILALPVCFCFSNGLNCDPVHSLNWIMCPWSSWNMWI